MGFDKNQLIESLHKRLQNEVFASLHCSSLLFLGECMTKFLNNVQATVAYYLLLDNRLRTTSGYLGAEFHESMVCQLISLSHLLLSIDSKFLANVLFPVALQSL
jgi:hypothetical protein